MSELRAAVERRSHPVLLALSRQPRFLVPLLAAALFVGVLLLPTALGAPCLLVLVGFLGWLSYLAWPALLPRGKVVRVFALIVLLTVGVRALTG